MIKSFKVELKPTYKQVKYFKQACGISRYIYNWGLNRRINEYRDNKVSLSYSNQSKELTLLKQEYDWLYNVGKFVHQNALMNLNSAFINFFRELKKGKVGFPKFKSKHKNTNSFQMDNDKFYITQDRIKIITIGSIKLKEKDYLPLIKDVIKYCRSTISERGNRWFISISAEVKDCDIKEVSKEIVGVDVGIKTLATCSDGSIFENPKAYKKYLKKLKKEQRRLSRKQYDKKTKKSSNNRIKNNLKIKKLYYKISNVRHDNLHKLTSFLAKTKPKIVVIEDLNVKGMIKNHKLAAALADASFGEIKRQLEYKSAWYGGELFYVDRFFPSSKLCSSCGTIKEDLTLNDRVYSCDCGLTIDRDLNASINLKNYYIVNKLGSARPESTLGESLMRKVTP